MSIINLPADKWTLSAPAGFGVAQIQPQGDQTLMAYMSATAPSDSDTSLGAFIGGMPDQQTIGNDSNLALYLRPVIPGVSSKARVNY